MTETKCQVLHSDLILWTVDTEFMAMPRPYHTCVLTVTIREYESEAIVFSSTIDYGGIQLDDMVELISREYHNVGKVASAQFVNVAFARKQHQSHVTTGFSLSAVGDKLREAGFSPEMHRLICWYTKADMNLIGRALRGEDDFLNGKPSRLFTSLQDSNDNEVFKPFDIARLMKATSSLESCALGYTYRSLFQDVRACGTVN